MREPFRRWSDLTDEEASRVVQELAALGYEIAARPKEQGRVLLDATGAIYLVVLRPRPIHPMEIEVDGTGEGATGYLEATPEYYPAAEAVALLADPGRSPETELERRRAYRKQRDAEREAVKQEREARARAEAEAADTRRRLYAQHGGAEFEALPPTAAAFYDLARRLGPEHPAVARIVFELAEDCNRRGTARDGRPPFPYKPWRERPLDVPSSATVPAAECEEETVS